MLLVDTFLKIVNSVYSKVPACHGLSRLVIASRCCHALLRPC